MEPVIPSFAGATVIRVQVDHMLRLWTDTGWQFNLEADVTMTTSGRPPAVLDTSVSLEDTPPELRRLIGASITDVTVSGDGDLAIRTSDGHLSVRAQGGFEAWQMHGPRGEIIVCMPGGELAVWGPRTE